MVTRYEASIVLATVDRMVEETTEDMLSADETDAMDQFLKSWSFVKSHLRTTYFE